PALAGMSSCRHVETRDVGPFPTRRSSDLWGSGSAWSPWSRRRTSRRPPGRAGGQEVPYAGGRVHVEVELGVVDGAQHRARAVLRSEEHTSELQSRENLVCRLLLEKKDLYT